MERSKGFAAALLIAALAASTGFAQGDAAAPCSSPEHRQFDFWLGSWQVTQGDQVAGNNRIRSILGGCVLEESWQGASGSVGHSYNLYDAARGVWHQTWVDASGSLLLLEGGLVDGAMVLTGTRPGRDGGGEVQHRITWTPRPDGTVRQHWQASKDGESWQDLFDGSYAKAGE